MKNQKNAVVAAAIVTGLTAFSAVQAAPSIYGKANITVQSFDEADSINVESNASRLGIKGEVELPEGMTAIYQAEYEIKIDDTTTFSQRNIYGGLKGSMGTVKVGYFDTIIKKGQGKVDLFNDLLVGDIKSVIKGDNRGANTIQFESGKFANGAAKAKFAIFQGEALDGDDTDNDAADPDNNGFADGYAFGIDYSAGPLQAAIAYSDSADSKGSIATDETILRVSAQYKTEGGVKLGALVQQYDDNANDGMGYVVSASFPMGESYAFNVQYAAADEDVANKVETQTNIGLVKKISKKVKTFAYYGTQDAKGGGDGETTIGAGMEIKF